MIANGKHRKKRIYSLENGSTKVEGHANLKSFITKFYKGLFGEPEKNSFTLDESIIRDIPQVSSQENNLLTAEFSESEIKEAIFSMKHNKAPGPDGFPAEFYQRFWKTVKEDLLQMFRDLSKGDLPLFSLNFGVITLIPKVQEVNVIQQYRPICLLNVSYKIFTKVATNRLSSVADKGRNILEGVVILHETIHELHRKNQSGVILKLDFEKAYDKTFISGGSVAVNVNDDVGHYFQTKKGFRQGDPLSPLLFNITVDMLKVFISRAKTDGQFEGVIPHLVDGGLSILRYADDTILFMDHDLDKARNMKLLLFAFELASGLKINFHESELLCFGAAQENIELYTELFGCKAGNFPINYLGIPIHYRKLRNSDWVKVEKRFLKKLNSWKGKHLSIGGRLTLINSVLTSLPMYMMSFFSIPKGVLKKLDYFRSRFFWQGDENKKKYRLAKWTILLIAFDGLWQQILRNKYVGSKPLVQVEWKVGDSHFWSCLMKVKLDFLRFGTFIVKDRSQVKFWEDNWLDGTPLRNQYPSLYNIARSKFITIA
ncbi:hypothetical protein U9M48_036551 [Paspalum notatum var. saurae]|uniref:Reverse transcriptase domain-containing protein n=1 Tax=Paspalum notatum var. saurae TaxID=547442 RepID=A0AAQ3UJF0_PASNO